MANGFIVNKNDLSLLTGDKPFLILLFDYYFLVLASLKNKIAQIIITTHTR